MLIKMPYIRVGKPLPYICNKIRLRGVEYIYLATFGPLGPTPYTHYVPLSRVFIRLKWGSKCVLSGAVGETSGYCDLYSGELWRAGNDK